MRTASFTQSLNRFFPDLTTTEIKAGTVREAINELESRWPGLSKYIVDDQGALRKHVHVFIGNEFIKDRRHLSDPIGEGDKIYIMQALSGG